MKSTRKKKKQPTGYVCVWHRFLTQLCPCAYPLKAVSASVCPRSDSQLLLSDLSSFRLFLSSVTLKFRVFRVTHTK